MASCNLGTNKNITGVGEETIEVFHPVKVPFEDDADDKLIGRQHGRSGWRERERKKNNKKTTSVCPTKQRAHVANPFTEPY